MDLISGEFPGTTANTVANFSQFCFACSRHFSLENKWSWSGIDLTRKRLFTTFCGLFIIFLIMDLPSSLPPFLCNLPSFFPYFLYFLFLYLFTRSYFRAEDQCLRKHILIVIWYSSDPAQLFTPCNLACNCSRVNYAPVCGGQLTYFSPCHAGCSNLTKTSKVSYVEKNMYFKSHT